MSRRPRSRPPAWASRACRRWRRPWPTPSPRPPASACARCVARTWGSSPRPPGAMMAIRADGAVAGSVS
ncbi:XdhC family protein, partial [Bordetella pertussis]|uniref:XdhC family protein n=1 Tax=Bordetella pertussis TaxID=520 RepID=UPI0038795E32